MSSPCFLPLEAVYTDLYSDADPRALIPSLKLSDFVVNNGYAIQNHRSVEEYFRYVLTKDDITDIRQLRTAECILTTRRARYTRTRTAILKSFKSSRRRKQRKNRLGRTSPEPVFCCLYTTLRFL